MLLNATDSYHENLDTMYSKANAGFMALMKDILEYNPLFRKSAEECLQNPLFDKIREKTLEKACPIKVELDFDDDYDMPDSLNQWKYEA